MMKRVAEAIAVGSLLVGAVVVGGLLTSTFAGAAIAPREVPVGAIPHPDVEVFMDLSATPSDFGVVRSRVLHTAAVRRFAFLDHAAALAAFQLVFRDDPALLRSVAASDLPESFRLDLAHASDVPGVRRAFAHLAGVDEVRGPVKKPSLEQQLRQRIELCRSMDYQLEVFMNPHATEEEVDGVLDAIDQEHNATLVRFLDHDAALRKFRQIFASDPKLRDSISAADLPESFELRVPTSEQAIVQHDLALLPGVDEITIQPAFCRAVNSGAVSVA